MILGTEGALLRKGKKHYFRIRVMASSGLRPLRSKSENEALNMASLWKRRQLMVALAKGKTVSEVTAIILDRPRSQSARVRAKALLRMRMFGRSSDYDYTEVDNVLAAPLDGA